MEFTECEIRQMIKSMAMGMDFETIAMDYECDISDVEKICRENREEITAEMEFIRRKDG